MLIDVGSDSYGGKFKFLTFIDALLQTTYFGLAFVVDIVDRKTSFHVRRWRDNFFSILAFPVGTFVVVTFWAIYAVDRELVYPKELDKIIPAWMNHAMHTTVLPLLLLEKYLIYHKYPCRRDGMLGLLFFASLYAAWIFWIAYYVDLWVYPILQVLQIHERAIFIVLLYAFFISIYILGEAITKFLWRNHIHMLTVQKKKIK
ncbi:hypothetical protein ScPMuIL_008365 [Solemya velum]